MNLNINKINTNIFPNYYKKLWIATKTDSVFDDYGNEIPKYNKPFLLGTFNYQPMTQEEIRDFKQVYGETKNKLVRLYLDNSYLGKIKDFDVAYLYGNTPSNEVENGYNANYEVRLVAEQNTKIWVVFEEIIKEEN